MKKGTSSKNVPKAGNHTIRGDAPIVTIDLTERDLRRRFAPLKHHAPAGRAICSEFLDQLLAQDLRKYEPLIKSMFWVKVPSSYREEVEAIADLFYMDPFYVMLANLYYDFAIIGIKGFPKSGWLSLIGKLVQPGCSAFGVPCAGGVAHGRNLDWPCQDHSLARSTLVYHYKARLRAESFYTVSWPGFCGALTGIKPGAFALSLNAVVSDQYTLGKPVSFFLREVLQMAPSFDAALEMVSCTPLLADCILLLTGTEPGQAVVVERTPGECRVRRGGDGVAIATNHYLEFSNRPVGKENIIEETACGRYDRMCELLEQGEVPGSDAVFSILKDEQVRMNITMQSIYMNARTGELEVRLPG